jgi:hypothetical protein
MKNEFEGTIDGHTLIRTRPLEVQLHALPVR